MIAEDYLFIEPDWSEGIVITRAWRNSVLSSLNKFEQRSRLVSYPDRGMRFDLLPMSASESSYIRRRLYHAKDKVFGIPWWVDRTATTQLVDSGSGTTFTVGSTDYRNFDVGGLCVVYQDRNNYEVKEIVSITSTSITAGSSFTGTWASGTYVYPILQGRLSKTHDYAAVTSSVAQPIVIDFKESFDADVTRRTFSGSSFNSYLSSPVFNRKPNWVNTLENKIEVYSEVTKFFSKEISYSFQREGAITSNGTHLFESKAELYDFIKFFDEMCGRWDSFWYPTWLDDVVITDPFISTDTSITIEDIEWNDYYKDDDTYGRFLYIELADGTEIIRRVVSAPTSTSLQLSSAIGETVTSTYGILCSFLMYGRFATDDIEVKYYTEEVSEVQANFVSLVATGIYTTTTT